MTLMIIPTISQSQDFIIDNEAAMGLAQADALSNDEKFILNYINRIGIDDIIVDQNGDVISCGSILINPGSKSEEDIGQETSTRNSETIILGDIINLGC